jgi:hypothetical protein
VADFTVDPDDDMGTSHFFSPNTSSPAPPPPQQETMMAAAAGGDNYISVHPSFVAAMSSSQFQFQAPPFAQGFLPRILAPLGGGNNNCSVMAPRITWMDLQTEPPPPPPLDALSTASWIYPPHSQHNATTKIAPSVHPHGFGPGLYSSSYGFAGGDTHHRLSTGTGYHDLSSRLSSFPSQPSCGVVGSGSNAQGSAASMVAGSEEWQRLLQKVLGPK